jgi:hypothetical protein
MVRRQDLNADGDTDDAGEERIVGAANRIDEARFGLNEDILTVTLSASELMEGRRGAPVRVTVTTRVYLAN